MKWWWLVVYGVVAVGVACWVGGFLYVVLHVIKKFW